MRLRQHRCLRMCSHGPCDRNLGLAFVETVRPLLLHGLASQPGEESGAAHGGDNLGPRERAGLEIGRAMSLLLPALDGNDEDKLLAALSFYTSVFSSCTALVGIDEAPRNGHGAVPVGIDLSAFAADLLHRLFAAIDTLQSGKESMAIGDDDAYALFSFASPRSTHVCRLWHVVACCRMLVACLSVVALACTLRAGDGRRRRRCRAMPSSLSWLGDHFKLHALMAQLFQKLPEKAADVAADVIFTRTATLLDPRHAEDAAILVEFACQARVDAAVRKLLRPLLTAVAEDVASEPADGASHPCRSS